MTVKLKSILAVVIVGLIVSGCAPSKPVTFYAQWPFDATEAAQRQGETATALGVPKEAALDLGKGVSMKLNLIPAGRFMLGSPNQEKGRQQDESPLHEVRISTPFYMGASNVTRGQFAAFVKETGYKTDVEKGGDVVVWDGFDLKTVKGVPWNKPGFDQTDEHPVLCVSYNDAVAFCKWLSDKTGRAVKLPTEAQWEYAARAGTSTLYIWGDNPDGGKGWCNGNDLTAKKKFSDKGEYFNWDDGYLYTSPVAKFKPNAFGLYDTHGNAAVWCGDWYDKDYYAKSPRTDPQGPAYGKTRVVRGGCWGHYPVHDRSAYRLGLEPANGFNYVGFRVVVLPN
jgi:formylglycine-generating enzyme required for sulfatase activity